MKALLQKHPLQEEGPKVYIVRSGADAIVSRFRKVFERDEKQRSKWGWKPEENVFDTEAEAAEFEIYRFGGTNGGEHVFKLGQFQGIGFAEEFQGDVEIFGAYPFQLRREVSEIFQQGGERGSNTFGDCDGDEEPHGGNLA